MFDSDNSIDGSHHVERIKLSGCIFSPIYIERNHHLFGRMEIDSNIDQTFCKISKWIQKLRILPYTTENQFPKRNYLKCSIRAVIAIIALAMYLCIVGYNFGDNVFRCKMLFYADKLLYRNEKRDNKTKIYTI